MTEKPVYVNLTPMINLLRNARKKATSPMHDNILLNTQQILELQAHNEDTTDVLKVVRCKNCKFYTNNIPDGNLKKGYCHRIEQFCFNTMSPDDFCSKAEKLTEKS